ncbi:transposase [Sediminihabitans luteus]|uniref:Transposase n=1 Tax=Sediminihabitans luteus TaxID=1138585 RepID=A0A2M9CYQ1_9CELL|nr:transposase [Sediminihabitans luteus]PJJ77059.1 transposase [Sediminihabitans luteus]GIJ00422.1 hypothetical protein Slu03_27990 [Sediminihabitans luteus]
MPKKIDPELRARAVRLLREHNGECQNVTAASIAVAKQLGVSQESVRRWVTQAAVDGGTRPGVSTEELAEIRRLKAENKRLRESNEIVKAASNPPVHTPSRRAVRFVDRALAVARVPGERTGGGVTTTGSDQYARVTTLDWQDRTVHLQATNVRHALVQAPA